MNLTDRGERNIFGYVVKDGKLTMNDGFKLDVRTYINSLDWDELNEYYYRTHDHLVKEENEHKRKLYVEQLDIIADEQHRRIRDET